MIPIILFTWPPTLHKVYYKVRQVLLQSATALIITKCDDLLLQSATGFFIAKCDRYCKVRQLLQSVTDHTRASVHDTDIPGPAIIGLQTFTDWLEPIHIQPFFSRQRYHTLQRYSFKEVTREKDKQYVISQYPESFNAVGRFQGEYHIVLEPSLPPVVHPPRRVTFSLNELHQKGTRREITLERRSKKMNSHNGSTALFTAASRAEVWGSTWTPDLNTAIQIEHHVTPTLEEIVLKLTDTEVFSTREAKCGYWDVQWYWQLHLVSSWNKRTISNGMQRTKSLSTRLDQQRRYFDILSSK